MLSREEKEDQVFVHLTSFFTLGGVEHETWEPCGPQEEVFRQREGKGLLP